MHVVLCDLPPGIRGMVVKTFDEGDDYYTIVISSRLSRSEQQEVYRHELGHIEGGDFSLPEVSTDTIEYVRHMI